MKDVYILGIETSCDETSMSIVKNGCEDIATSTLSQIPVHTKYGGVFPEVASRMHTESILFVLEDLLSKTDLKIEDMDAIAVTYAPGLIGSLLVGLECAKSLALVYKKPLIKVNHLAGHIYANNLSNKMEFPLLALVVSGGHTELINMTGDYEFEILGATLDDALGEVYDKVARVIDLPYPGGPNIEKYALEGQHSYDLPTPMKDNSLNFSFSGLKSAVINLAHNQRQKGVEVNKYDLARSFQDVAIDEIIRKTRLAIHKTGAKRVLVAGGVSANKFLRSEMKKLTEECNIDLLIPAMNYCTDNGTMIASAAYPLYLKSDFSDFSINATSTDKIQ